MRASWEGDRDPLVALAAGDPGPFEDFVRTEATTFLGFFGRLGATPEEAEDLAQEVFLKLFQHARRYRSDERFAAFAFRIARNAWVDRTRRRATRRATQATGQSFDAEGELGDPIERLADEAPGTERRIGHGEDSRRLFAALATLSETHRSVFELGAVQGLSYQEVGALLEIPVGTVKSRMFHAVRRLREALDAPREERA